MQAQAGRRQGTMQAMRVFAYGSLMFEPELAEAVIAARPGRLRGWSRKARGAASLVGVQRSLAAHELADPYVDALIVAVGRCGVDIFPACRAPS
jgi:hypothetical protein